jgi:hypothetical protein
MTYEQNSVAIDGRSEERQMEESRIVGYLIVNRVQVLSNSCCRSCGRGFTSNPMGEKALLTTAGEPERPYYFCGTCGDAIMSRVESEQARNHYAWDWAVPLREENRDH